MNDTLAIAANAAHPALLGKARLITLAFQQGNVEQLRQELLARAQNDASDVHAVLDLSMALLLSGQRDSGLALQLHAVQAQPLYHMPASVQPAAVRLLALVSRGDFLANTPLEFLVADSDVSLHILYMGADVPAPAALPEHDALIVAVGESAANQTLLRELTTALVQWHKPVLNRPEHVLQTSRDGVCAALQNAPGVVCAPIARVDRDTLAALAAGGALAQALPGAQYPVLVRPLDSHAGLGLRKIDQASDMAAYLQEESGASFYLSQFIEYRSPDQRYRKYRVVLVDGRPFLGHLGISPRWMVHYLNADMVENALNREEEAHAMAHFDATFALDHADAFRAIHERLRLDYLVMDCAQTQDGRLLVFEADTCGVVHDMDSAELYPYKHVQMQKIFSAFRRMLADKAAAAQA
jgi:hypothetical protein